MDAIFAGVMSTRLDIASFPELSSANIDFSHSNCCGEGGNYKMIEMICSIPVLQGGITSWRKLKFSHAYG
eukprot:snap_masked-scaffold_11-processed-gene-9.1-mRNA-1 protein AED:1.00 eAED:1.00 QI:0/0/0/0/1/1/2/0/69